MWKAFKGMTVTNGVVILVITFIIKAFLLLEYPFGYIYIWSKITADLN